MSNWKALIYPLIIIFIIGAFALMLSQSGIAPLNEEPSILQSLIIGTIEIIILLFAGLLSLLLLIVQLIPNMIIAASKFDLTDYNPFTTILNNLISAINFLTPFEFSLVGSGSNTIIGGIDLVTPTLAFFESISIYIVERLTAMALYMPTALLDPMLIILSLWFLYGVFKTALP